MENNSDLSLCLAYLKKGNLRSAMEYAAQFPEYADHAERIARGFASRLNKPPEALNGLPVREVQAVSLALFRESAGEMERKYLRSVD